MESTNPLILTINSGSSSIKFALFESGDSLRRIMEGGIDRIGLPEATWQVKGLNKADNFSRPITVPDHITATSLLMDWVQERIEHGSLTAVGHRVVHGGPKYWEPQRITSEMIEELRQLEPFDPEHLPEEIQLIEAFRRRFPDLPQVACFDTAFHHDMPRSCPVAVDPAPLQGAGATAIWVSWTVLRLFDAGTRTSCRHDGGAGPRHSRPPRQRRKLGRGA